MFHGYFNDLTQQHRLEQDYCRLMTFNGKKKDFLSNSKENVAAVITLLDEHLRRNGYHPECASADSDDQLLDIVQTATATSKRGDTPTVIVADDTDILILLLPFIEN